MTLACLHYRSTQIRLRCAAHIFSLSASLKHHYLTAFLVLHRSIIFLASFVSVILSIFSIHRCTFGLAVSTTDPNAPIYAWGLFSTPVYDADGMVQGCIPYPSSIELGASLKIARAFGVVLLVFITIIFLGLTLVHFFLERWASEIYHIIRVLLPSAFLCQLLTFAGFASKFCSEIVDESDEQKGTSPSSCIPGDAGVVAIFNLVAIIVMTTLMTMVTPPEHPMFQLYGTGNSIRAVPTNRPAKNQSTTDCESQLEYPFEGRTTGVSQYGRSSHRSRDRYSCEVEKDSIGDWQQQGRSKIRITVINGPDVRKTIKEITHPDGSQTITTTVEELALNDSDTESDCDGDSITITGEEFLDEELCYEEH